MRTRSARWMVVLGVIILSLLLASCGPRSANLRVTMTDFEFAPDAWEVPSGAEVTITMINDGALEHEWIIMEQGYEVTVPFDADDEPHILWREKVAAGETGTFVFTAPEEEGEYEVVCGILPHIEQGMVGTLLVTR